VALRWKQEQKCFSIFRVCTDTNVFFQVFFSKVSWNNHTSRQKWKNSFGLECYSILFLNPPFFNYFSDSLDSISRYIPSFGLSSSVVPNAHSLPPSPSDDVVSPLTSSTSPLTSPRDLTCFPTPGEFAGERVALLSKRVDVQRHSAHVSHALPQLMQSTCRKQFVCALECLSRLVRWKQKRQTTSICFQNELSFVPASAPSHKQMIGSRFYATGRKQSKQCCLWTWNTEHSNLRCQKACLIWAFWRPTPTAEFRVDCRKNSKKSVACGLEQRSVPSLPVLSLLLLGGSEAVTWLRSNATLLLLVLTLPVKCTWDRVHAAHCNFGWCLFHDLVPVRWLAAWANIRSCLLRRNRFNFPACLDKLLQPFLWKSKKAFNFVMIWQKPTDVKQFAAKPLAFPITLTFQSF